MKQNIILILISATLLTISCGAARNSTAVDNAVEPDSLLTPTEIVDIAQSIDSSSDTTKAIESNRLNCLDVPSRIMVMDHRADFPYTGGERTIYTFSHNGW